MKYEDTRIRTALAWAVGDYMNMAEERYAALRAIGLNQVQEVPVIYQILDPTCAVVAKTIPAEERDPNIPWHEYRKRVCGY